MAERAHWQVQEAKQRFSEVLRAVEQEGPQIITRHGVEVAAILSAAEYRKLTGRDAFIDHLRSFPKIESDGPDVFDEIEAERKREVHRPSDFEIELGLVDEPADAR